MRTLARLKVSGRSTTSRDRESIPKKIQEREKANEKVNEKATERAIERAIEKAIEKAKEKRATLNSDQISNTTADTMRILHAL
jgi:phosphomannomutase